MTKQEFRELLSKGPLILDGATGSNLRLMGMPAGVCTEKWVNEHPEVIQAFTNALQKGMDYVNSHTAEEVANTILPQFAETDVTDATMIIERYQAQDTWKDTLVFEEEAFTLLQDILRDAGQLDKTVPYEKLVDTSFAKNAAKTE